MTQKRRREEEADRRGVSFGVSKVNSIDPGPVNGAEAHGAWLATCVNFAAGKAVGVDFGTGRPNGNHFGVGGWVVGAGHLVLAFADDAPVLNDHSAKRAAAAGGDIRLGEGDCAPHKTIPIHLCSTPPREFIKKPYHVGVGDKYRQKDKRETVQDFA